MYTFLDTTVSTGEVDAVNPPEQALTAPTVPAADRLRTPAAGDHVSAVVAASDTPAPSWFERIRDLVTAG